MYGTSKKSMLDNKLSAANEPFNRWMVLQFSGFLHTLTRVEGVISLVFTHAGKLRKKKLSVNVFTHLLDSLR